MHTARAARSGEGFGCLPEPTRGADRLKLATVSAQSEGGKPRATDYQPDPLRASWGATAEVLPRYMHAAM